MLELHKEQNCFSDDENIYNSLESLGWCNGKLEKATIFLKEVYRFIIPKEGYRYKEMLDIFYKNSQVSKYLSHEDSMNIFEVFNEYNEEKNVEIEPINYYSIDRSIEQIPVDLYFLKKLYYKSKRYFSE